MKIAIIASNYIPISPDAKKGTEVFLRTLINSLYELPKENNVEITVFASGDSVLPVKIESIREQSSIKDSDIIKHNKHIIFELALISKAISMTNDFDLFHANIGDGDIVLPFARFTKKPILITLHHTLEAGYIKNYFSLFTNLSNIFFVATSNYQKKLLSEERPVYTIYHGINLAGGFNFDPQGGESLIWAGRAIPVKGPDLAVQAAQQLNRSLRLFALLKEEHATWFQEKVIEIIDKTNKSTTLHFDTKQERLISFIQKSRAFIFPVSYEEAFGLVLIESMACGTPVIAFAKGAIPEVIKDGETGFIVNISDKDIRGSWIVKKTGLEGLKEAVEKIYNMSSEDYRKMRKKCRQHVEKNFTSKRMTTEYVEVYKRILTLG